MFKKKSPVKKKFAAPTVAKRRRQIDPRTRQLIKQVAIGFGLVIVVSILLTIVWYVTRLPFLTITTVTVTGGETIDTTVIQKQIEERLVGEYIGFIPRRFVYLYPEADVETILREVPRLKDPQIERAGTTLRITFSEYTPYALWCADRESTTCLFLDSEGYAFGEAPRLEGGAFPRFHIIGTAPAVRTQMLPTEDLRAIERLREALGRELRFPVAFVETDIVRDVFLGIAGGGEVKASLRMPVDETVANLKSILASDEFNDLAPGSFQYIDLRFGNKVFVNEEDPSLIAASTTATSSPFTPVDAAMPSVPVAEVDVATASTTASSSAEIDTASTADNVSQ